MKTQALEADVAGKTVSAKFEIGGKRPHSFSGSLTSLHGQLDGPSGILGRRRAHDKGAGHDQGGSGLD